VRSGRSFLALVAWVVILPCVLHARQLAIITDKTNTTTNLTAADLVKIFNARSRNWQNGRAESDTYRQMAMYQQNPKQALIFLDKAEAVARKTGNPLKIAMVQELAQILRARVEVDLKMGKKKMADSDVARLAKMSESSGDKQIEVEYHGANGAVLFSQHKYDEAISHLEEDPDNPFSLRLLVVAYQKIGYSAGAKWASEILANFNDPTLEQALVVPAFRKCYDTPACSDHAKAAPLHR
jgi:hypothetical protein